MDEVSEDGADQRPPAEDLEAGNGWIAKYLPYQLYKVTNLLNQRLHKRLKLTGVNLSQWRIMSVLRSYGRLTLSQIIEHTLMEQPTVSRVVAQLERDGIVTRHTCDEDSRVVQVQLTTQGANTFNEIVPTAFRHQKIAFETLPADELKSLQQTLRKIERNITQVI
ncbi:MarR family winged helix-turn-helix transcriptional regulator [Pacificimonas sp. ICDLI1SI03]